MLAAFFDFIRDLAWELVVLQLNPLLGLVLAGIGALAAWGTFHLMRR
jgi:hypothetical protein